MASTALAPDAPTIKERAGHRTRKRREAAAAYALLTPSLIGVILFLLAPVILVIILSFADWNLLADPELVGTENYEWLADNDRFKRSLWVTALFTLLAIPATMVIGFLIAAALNRKLPGSGFIQLLYVLPWVCAPLTLGVVWSWMLSPREGLINRVMGTSFEWLSDPKLALPTIAFVYMWQNIGYVSLFFLAGLQSIPTSVLEAAKLDGAGPIRSTWSIVVPLLRPTTFFVLVTSVISSFQVFDLVVGLTGSSSGYPRGTTLVIASYIYNEVNNIRIGRAAAVSVILLIVIVAITLVQQRYFSKRMTYDMT